MEGADGTTAPSPRQAAAAAAGNADVKAAVGTPPEGKLASACEETEGLQRAEAGRCAPRPGGTSSIQLQLFHSGSGLSRSSTVGGSATRRGAAAAAAAPKPKLTVRQWLQSYWHHAVNLWWGLPSACKATVVVAVINFCISVVYAVVGLLLPDVDEEIHISLTIIISAVFVVGTVVDAIIYENTLELATSILLDTLVLGRVIWFAARGSANAGFKWAWCSIMVVVQVIFIICAGLAWRQFGWRLYGKLGVDFREKGAAEKMRAALQRNAYVTLLKVNAMLLVVLAAVGIDVSFEKRGGDVEAAMLAVSLAGLAVGCASTWLASRLVLTMQSVSSRVMWLYHLSALTALGHPIATLLIYNVVIDEDLANANISMNVGCGIYIVTSLGTWVCTHQMVRLGSTQRRARAAATSVPLSSTSSVLLLSGDPVLAPMYAGAWLGKPTQRNPRKIRFFQLSHDGSTLRWGWNKFVRLYYVDDLACDDAQLTITLAFPFDTELVLKFRDEASYHVWRQGLARLLLMLMAPDMPHEGPSSELDPGSAFGPVGRTSSRGLLKSAAGAAEAAVAWGGEEAGGPAPSSRSITAASLGLLQQLGVSVQQLGKRVTPKRWQAQLQRRRSEGGEPAMPTTNRTDEDSSSQPPPSARDTAELEQQRRQASEAQLAKRQRMTAYLQTVSAAQPPVRQQAAAAAAAAADARRRLRERHRPSVDGKAHLPGTAAPVPAPAAKVRKVSVAVQTDESELQCVAGAAYASWRTAAPPTPSVQSQAASPPPASGGGDADVAEQCLAALQAAASGGHGPDLPPLQQQPLATIGEASGDADVAVQYMAAMAAAAGGVSAGPAASTPAAAQQPAEPGGDADVAAQYMAAMAAAAGGDATPAAAVQHKQQAGGDGGGGGDADIAAQYMAAMAAAAGGGGATPSPQPPTRSWSGQLRASPFGQPSQRRQSWQASQAAPPTPLEQLAWQQQQQQRSLASSRGPQSPTSPLDQLAWQQKAAVAAPGCSRLSATPPPGLSQPMASGLGLWQLAAAVDVIDIEELSFGKLLGAGAEGAVYAAWFLESPVAVKKFDRVEDSLHEVEMYLRLGSHDNVVALRGLCQHDGSMYLVLEYCPRGTLDVLLHHSAKNPWDPTKLLALVRSIARGMHYLHSRNILHRDLKPANIFVGHGQMMKIGDFGMARIMAPVSEDGGPPLLRRLTPGTVGTMQYAAPELINDDLRPAAPDQSEWALKLDVWSFGVTLWEVLERRRPFEGLSQRAVQAQWITDPYAARLPPVRLPEQLDRTGKRILRGLSDLVEDCTRLDPYARPSFRDILLRLKSLVAFSERQGAIL